MEEHEVGEQVKALRRRALGNTSLELLLALRDQKLLIKEAMYRSWGGSRLTPNNYDFYSSQDFTAKKEVLAPATAMRIIGALDGLERREYLTVTHGSIFLQKIQKEGLIEPNTDVANFLRQDQVNGKWTVRIFEINRAGLEALEGMRARIAKLQNANDERFVVSRRTNHQGHDLGGVCNIYHVVKSSPSRYLVEAMDGKEGIPNQLYDPSRTYVQVGNKIYYWIEKANIIMHDVTIDQYIQLKAATEEMDRKLVETSRARELEMEPIVRKYENREHAIKDEVLGIINHMFEANQVGREDRIEAEDGFVMGLEEDDLLKLG